MAKEIKIKGFEDIIPSCKGSWTRSAQAYKNEVNRNYRELSKEELSELVSRAQREKNASKKTRLEEQILNALGPLIMRLAMQYASSENYMDYVQDACMTVIRQCIDGFDTKHSSNSSFVTYCKRAIVANFNVTANLYDIVSTGLKKSELSLIKNYVSEYTKLKRVEPSDDQIKRLCKEHDITYVRDIQNGLIFQSVDEENDDDFEQTRTGGNGQRVTEIVDKLTVDANLEPDVWVDDFDATNVLIGLRKIFICVQNDEINKRKNEQVSRYKNNIRDIDILFKYYGVAGFEKKSTFELSTEYDLCETMIKLIINRTPKLIMDIVKKNITNI